jgi:hypothetical protein
MGRDYYIDLGAVTLDEYEQELGQAELIPSRQILKDSLKERFSAFKENGISNVDQLLAAMKTPDKMKVFAQKTNVPEEYLTILKREIASSQPKPVNLSEFPGIDANAIDRLEQRGIRNTLQLFPHIITEADRKKLSEEAGIPCEIILELTKLTDVCRIKWVGANFARLLVDSKWDTAMAVSKADYEEVYRILMKINEEKKYFKGKFGLNDMKLCVAAAKKVPGAIQFE